MHKDSGQKKHKQAITRMPVPTTFHIDNGQNNQLEIESLMHPADASNFIAGGSKAVTLAVLHPKRYSYLSIALHFPLSGWVTNSQQTQDGIYGSCHAPVQNLLLLSRNDFL